MQPKPIDTRHLLDVDTRKRFVDGTGDIQQLRGVREHKEHPAETDYDIIHDELGRRNRDESAKRFIDGLKKDGDEPAEEKESEDAANTPGSGRGSNIDAKA